MVRYPRSHTKTERRKAAAKLKSEQRKAKKAKLAFWAERHKAVTEDHYTPNAPTPILDLPPELRNRIWEDAMSVSENPINTYFVTPPALLRTCRQIRNEASGIFWSQPFAFIVGHNAWQRVRYSSAEYLQEHCKPGEISVHAAAQMRLAGTLGLSPTLKRDLRDPFLQARFTRFEFHLYDDWRIKGARAAPLGGVGFPNKLGTNGHFRLAVKMNGHGRWDVNLVFAEVDRMRQQMKDMDLWQRFVDGLMADVRGAIDEIVVEGDAVKGMDIDHVARVAMAVRYDIMLVRDLQGNVVMAE